MSSYWIESTKDLKKDYKSLNEDSNIDVCIIGAALVGITSAYYLSDSNLKVAIIERDKVCSHVSAYSTAKITSQHNLFYDYLIYSFGKKFAKNYLYANEDAIKRIKDIIQKEKFDCDFSMQDSYVYTYSKEDMKDIHKEVKAVQSLDFPCEFVTNMPLPIESFGAIKFQNQAQFNPRKYALSICNIISQKGINIYTDSTVTKVDKVDDGYVIYANNHIIRAKYVILAIHYPIINFQILQVK